MESNTDTEEGVDEYCEADDTFYYKEGWWEVIENWDEYGFVFIGWGSVSHWMPLPPAPTGEQEQ